MIKLTRRHLTGVCLGYLLIVFGIGKVTAQEVVQKISLLGSVAESGSALPRTLDRESYRLMVEQPDGEFAWSVHALMERYNQSGALTARQQSVYPYRVTDLNLDLTDSFDDAGDIIGVTLDHFSVKKSWGKSQLTLGRQPIDWGTGRLWQAHNVFGSFQPTALDTEFKPGIDGALLEYFPGDFSSLSFLAVANNTDLTSSRWSFASRFTSLIGEESEYSLLVGNVFDFGVLGLGFETSIAGVGVRSEASQFEDDLGLHRTLAVTGLDYQFDNGLLAVLEWRYQHQEQGFDSVSMVNSQQYALGRHYAGVSLSKDITPLLQGSYLWLYSFAGAGLEHSASLHQLNLSYSLSDESLILLSFLSTIGAEGSQKGIPASAFGEIGSSMTVNYRRYF